MHYVYILISKNKRKWSYVGSTSRIKDRFNEHCAGKVRSTKGYRPLELAYTEMHSSSSLARDRELYLKSGVGRQEKQILLQYSRVV